MVPRPIQVPPDRPVRGVLEVMNQCDAGAVLVAESDRLVGIFTERDLLRHLAAAPADWGQTPVGNWMTPDPHAVGPDSGWEGALALMERLRIRHLPVVEHGRVVGIVSLRKLIARRDEHLAGLVEWRTQELREANGQLMARDQEIRHHMKVAGRLQERLLLPHRPPDWPEVGWSLHFAALDQLGGDYYDFAQPDPDHLGVLIADASGHSIAAAMVAVMARIAFAEAAGHAARPGAVLAAMNRRLQGLTDDRFVTAFYGVLDRRTRTFTYANAGHPDPLRFSAATGRCEQLSARGFLLGIVPDESYEEKAIELRPGDRVCFYTDGLVESSNEIGWTFGADRVNQFFEANGPRPAAALMHDLLVELAKFRGDHPMGDDLTVLVAEVKGE
jgi:serine phosphatase RsbU (regulator of sigma subunit)